MIKIYNSDALDENVLNREIADYTEYEGAVRSILKDVRERGDAALLEYAAKFDNAKLDRLEVTDREFEEAGSNVDAALKAVFLEAAGNIKEFHSRQLRAGFSFKRGGAELGQIVRPIKRAGIYVPGGTASYPSTVLMNAIPAKLAGVGEIIMCTPPGKDGKIKAEILVAAKIAGVNRVFKCGGAGAIAAMAYGTESVPRADKITGPGNIYVALAKKEVFGTVGIDMIAGPSEILIIADKSADANIIAADMLSQAEHDKLASAVLVTDDKNLAKEVATELETQLCALPREEIARASIENNGKIIVADSLLKAAEVSNKIAPEHLELCVENPRELFEKIENAGSVFLGGYTPEALGDYFAGANHTLPTGGSARFSSPLSVDDFVKKTSFISYGKNDINEAADKIAACARCEGLEGHARAAEARKCLNS